MLGASSLVGWVLTQKERAKEFWLRRTNGLRMMPYRMITQTAASTGENTCRPRPVGSRFGAGQQ